MSGCKIKVIPVEKWLERGDNGKNCPPCLMNPLASNYLGILEEAGLKNQADKLHKAWDTGDIKTIARALDEIKKEVSSDINAQLMDCDCFAQEFEEGD